MAIDTAWNLKNTGGMFPNGGLSPRGSVSGGAEKFSACLAEQENSLLGASGAGSEEDPAGTVESRTDYTGFFKEILKKREEELREEILRKMGLTEEDLAQMDAEQRGRIEETVAREIRQRMTAASTLNAEEGRLTTSRESLFEGLDLLSFV